MFYFLCPREVADVNQTVNTFLKFNEDTEVCEVAYFCCMLAANRIFNLDCLPRIFLKLLDAERHLALVSVESKDDCLYLIAYVQEFLCTAQVLAPAHF